MSLGKLLLIPLCLLWFVAESATAQTQAAGSENLQAIADKVIQARSNNSQALKQYSWNQRTETLKDGEVMSTLLEVIRYDSNGNEQRSILVQEAPKQKKRIAGRIQKKKMAEIKEWGENIKSFLMLYSLPDLASLNSFLSKARIKSTEQPGQIVLTSNGVIQSGDRMTMHIMEKDKSIQKY